MFGEAIAVADIEDIMTRNPNPFSFCGVKFTTMSDAVKYLRRRLAKSGRCVSDCSMGVIFEV